jgi:hypothetical protein
MPTPGLHRPLRIVFMGLRIAKVHQQPIAEILGNMALEALDDRSTGLLYARTTFRSSSGSRRPARAVESTRSQNSTVS